jgi:hypothetical protein
VSEFRSALEALRAEVLIDVPDARIEEDFAELQRASELLDLERLRRLREIERRGLHRLDGHVSAAAWLRSRHRVSAGLAAGSVRLARALEQMGVTREAIASGEVSFSAARVLADVRGTNPEAFARHEDAFVQAARERSVSELERLAPHWREHLAQERDPVLEDTGPHAARKLHASVTFAGMVRVDGDLDPEAGEALLTALGAVLDAEARTGETETRTPAQRRADALYEICRQWLDRRDRPTVGGERPHLTVTVPVEVLGSAESEDPSAMQTDPLKLRDDALAAFDHVGPADPVLVRRLACDASLLRVVMGGPAQPLEVGRRSQVVPPAIRRAMIARDRRCRFPGCERPHPWCESHHVVPWAKGGTTGLSNLVLLCRRHHGLVHESGGFGLEMTDGTPVFRRPDGTILEDRSPPAATPIGTR